MHGQSPAASGNSSRRLDHRLRDLADRVRRLENRRTVTVGDWRLSQDKDGALVAVHARTGQTNTIAVPRTVE